MDTEPALKYNGSSKKKAVQPQQDVLFVKREYGLGMKPPEMGWIGIICVLQKVMLRFMRVQVNQQCEQGLTLPVDHHS